MDTPIPTPTPETAAAILKVSAGVTARPTSPADSKMGSWLPPRQVIAAGISGIVAWGVLAVLAHFGIDAQPIVNAVFSVFGTPAPDAQALLAGMIALAIANYVPPSVREIVQHLNDQIVHIAQRDPESNVSYVLPPVQPPPGDPPVIVPPATKSAP